MVSAQCSDPLKVIGAGRDGKEKYELTIVISASQKELGGLSILAGKNHWEMEDDFSEMRRNKKG